MASTAISALTTDSTPDRTADYSPTYDASAATNKKVLLQNYGQYSLTLSLINVAPADSSTYYMSPFALATGLPTVATDGKLRVARTGKIIAVYLDGVAGGGPTSENSTFSIRLNNTTDTTISSAVAFNASPIAISNTALSIAVTVGDYINVKWATPAWVTNPTGVYLTAQIVFA